MSAARKFAEALFAEMFGEDEADNDEPVIPVLPDIVEWAESRFYIGRGRRIKLQPVQKAVLREMFRQREDGRFVYHTGLYCTIKKSGKTTIAAVVLQWACETWGELKEHYHMGNKLGQAKQRAFKLVRNSIMWSPHRDEWEIQAEKMTHLPTGSFIQALPVNAAGEAGGHQASTTWTEFHGYIYEENNRMFEEMQPIPTEPLSFRFIESYAGYKGESNLLYGMWERALDGERIHDEFPIYRTADGLIAYIDQGVEARRMPWQTPEYYATAAANSLPHEYDRIHMNQWIDSQNALINVALWDRLAGVVQPREVHERKTTDVILAADASVSGDCTALAVIGWDAEGGYPIEYETFVWEPPKGGKLDYQDTLEPAIRASMEIWRVIGVAYDPYQLHDMMTRLKREYAPYDDELKADERFFYSFPQGGERLQADTALVSRIRQGNFAHSGNDTVRQHVMNADGKPSGDKAVRIVKREQKSKVDAVVAISMGVWRMYTLMTSRAEGSVVRRARVKFS